MILKDIYAIRHRGHVRAFANQENAVIDQILGIFGVNFVLSGTGKGAIGFVVPEWIVIQSRIYVCVHRRRKFFDIFTEAASTYVFKDLDIFKLCGVNAAFIIDVA